MTLAIKAAPMVDCYWLLKSFVTNLNNILLFPTYYI